MEKKYYIDVDKIKRLMLKKNIDLNTMAARMGITTRTLKRILDGADQRNMNSIRLIQFIIVLEVSAREIAYDKK